MADDKLTELENALALALTPPPPPAEPELELEPSAEPASDNRIPRWRVVRELSEGATFVLAPGALVRRIPRWGWGVFAGTLAVLFLAIVYAPAWITNRTVNRLADDDEKVVQEAMRRLAADPSNRAVRALSSLASSSRATERARLHAVDTLSLSRSPKADQALLDLATAADVPKTISQAAGLARRQRAGGAPAK